jgi:hypothetical protein
MSLAPTLPVTVNLLVLDWYSMLLNGPRSHDTAFISF